MKHKIRDYTVVFQEEIKGGYSVWVPELPGCASQGESFDEAVSNVREAIKLYLKDFPEQSNQDDFKKQFVVPVRIYA